MITDSYHAALNFAYSLAYLQTVSIYRRPVYLVEVDNDVDIDYEYLVTVRVIDKEWELITVISAKELESEFCSMVADDAHAT